MKSACALHLCLISRPVFVAGDGVFSVKLDLNFFSVLHRLYERADVGHQNDVLSLQKM
jgi:hypothetical protein